MGMRSLNAPKSDKNGSNDIIDDTNHSIFDFVDIIVRGDWKVSCKNIMNSMRYDARVPNNVNFADDTLLPAQDGITLEQIRNFVGKLLFAGSFSNNISKEERLAMKNRCRNDEISKVVIYDIKKGSWKNSRQECVYVCYPDQNDLFILELIIV